MCVKDKAVVFVIFCLLSVLLIISLFKYQTGVTHHYQRILVDLSLLEKNNSKIKEQVLLSQLGLLRNYDQIIQATSDMDRVFQRLIKDKNEINTEGNHEINKHLTMLDTEVSRLSIAVDHFLSANAVRNNSLIYLARQLRSFSEKDGAINSSKETHLAYRLMQEILLYNRWPESERKAEIDELSYQLQNSMLAPSLEEKNENIKLITDHIRVFTQYTDLANKDLDIILSSHISETTALLRITVLKMHQQYVNLERKIDTAVWVLCILLILLQMLAIRSKVTKHLLPK